MNPPAFGNHLCTLIPVFLIFFAFVSYLCFFLCQLFPAFLPSFFQLLIPQEFQVIDNGHFNNCIKRAKIRSCSGDVGEEVKQQSLWPQRNRETTFHVYLSQHRRAHYCPDNQTATHLKHSRAYSQHRELYIPLSSESGLWGCWTGSL